MEKELLDKISMRVYIHSLDYPGFCIADAYKLVYQGCMGPEHAITSPEAVKQWLDKEWDSVEASSGSGLLTEASTHDGLFADVTVHTPIYRINLRAAKAFGINKSQIHEEFLNLAKTFPKRLDLLKEIWAEISNQIESDNELVCNPKELAEFNKTIEENDYPAVHHSPEYREINKPAYRLVDEIMG